MTETQQSAPQHVVAKDAIVYVTTNYSMFKGVIGNREIYVPHLMRLVSSISELNLLKFVPVLVNEAMEVIDGQHRITAAKAKGEPVYYMIVPNAKLHEIQLLNRNSRTWHLEDFLESYIALGKRDYIKLKDFADEYRISVPIALSILSGELQNRGKMLQDFKDGKFVIKDLVEAEKMASLIVEIRRFSPDQAWVDRELMRALEVMVKRNIDPKLLLMQLGKNNLAVTRRVSVKEYLIELQEVLNFNNTSRVSLF